MCLKSRITNLERARLKINDAVPMLATQYADGSIEYNGEFFTDHQAFRIAVKEILESDRLPLIILQTYEDSQS